MPAIASIMTKVARANYPPGLVRAASARRKKLPSVTTFSPGFSPLGSGFIGIPTQPPERRTAPRHLDRGVEPESCERNTARDKPATRAAMHSAELHRIVTY